MNAEKIIVINSSQRNTGSTSASDFTLTVPGELLGNKTIKNVKVLDINIPITWYKINSHNNKFTLTDTGSVNIELPIQNYDSFTMQTVLENTLTANSPGGFTYTVDIDTATQKYTISTTTNFTLDFTVADSLGSYIGFDEAVYSGASSYTAPYVINLSPDNYIYVRSNLAAGIDQGHVILTTDAGNPNPSDVLFALPITQEFGFIEYHTDSSAPWVNTEGSTVGDRRATVGSDRDITFELYLESFGANAVDLNGRNWSMRLLVSGRDVESEKVIGRGGISR